MENTPLSLYGFSYEFEGREYSHAMYAESSDAAINRMAAMSGAQLVGELREATTKDEMTFRCSNSTRLA